MGLAFHAKAIAAFLVALLAPALFLLLLGAPTIWHIFGALIIGAFSGTLTALAVWCTPNRTHGINVTTLATALTDAGVCVPTPHKDNSK